MLTNELIREFGDRRKDVYGLAGVKDPNETNSTGPADTGPKPRYFNLQGQEIIK
jgi:hypothetical protein